MSQIHLVAGRSQVDLPPQTAENFQGDLNIVNTSSRLVKIIFDSAERAVLFKYQNHLGIEKSGNLLLGRNIARVVIQDSDNGIKFNYFLRDGM